MNTVVNAARGRRGGSYTLLTPANRYASRLPNLRDAVMFKLVTPRLSPARFGEYLVTLQPRGGSAAPVRPGFENFLYVLDGKVEVLANAVREQMAPGGWCYLPADAGFEFSALEGSAELLWLKRRYEPWPGLEPPAAIAGHRDDAPFDRDPQLPGFGRRELLDPADPAYDFNISLLAFDPGVGLKQVEIHDEEHGLYMTSGTGIYHLDGAEHEVAEHDFIYMAPYCPQSFAATGDAVAEYLLYKDVYRDGF